MHYLSPVDLFFLLQHHGRRPLNVMQGLWMFEEDVDDGTLEHLHRGLVVGPLNRRVVVPRIPGARPYFVPFASIAPLRVENAPIKRADVVAWADERAKVPLNPEHGIGWELSAARIAEGGTVISVVCSHVLTDAQGVVEAVQIALDPAKHPFIRVSAPKVRYLAELRDAARQLWGFVFGSLRAFYLMLVDGEQRDDLVRYLRRERLSRLRRKRAQVQMKAGWADPQWQPPTVIVDVPAEQWDAVAARSGGSANSLLVAVVSNILYTSGARLAHEPSTIGLPVRLDTAADEAEGGIAGGPRGNALTMGLLRLNPRGSRYGELFIIRKRIRQAVAKAAQGETPESRSPGDLPHQALFVLPEAVVNKILPRSEDFDALASYIGEAPAEFVRLGEYRVTATAARAFKPQLRPQEALDTRSALMGWLIKSNGLYTLSFVALDPKHFRDRRHLRTITIRELEKWGMTPQSWDSAEPGLGMPGGPSAIA
jgi:diacylglycerol O-acyltransferase